MNALFKIYDPTQKKFGSAAPAVVPGRIHNNTVMFRGHQFNYNTKSERFDHVIVAKGHWGSDVYAGCGDARVGKKEYLLPQNWSQYYTPTL